MLGFDTLYGYLEKNAHRRDEGKFNSILLPFPTMSKSFPGIERGRLGIVTANSGVGKTQLTKFMVFSIIEFCKQNGIPVHVNYYALEQGGMDFATAYLQNWLKFNRNVEVSSQMLKSLGNNRVPQNILDLIKEARSEYEEASKSISVVDNISNAYGIYKDIRAYAREHGEEEFIKTEEGDMIPIGYKAEDPEAIVINVVDHISLLASDKGMTQWETISKFSHHYMLKQVCKRFGHCVIMVQQQAQDQEKKQFGMMNNKLNVDKLLPSLDGLGDCKITQRDADWVFGLFAPDRYNIDSYGVPNKGDYDINVWRDNIRFMKILKDRWHGCANRMLPLFFDGAVNVFQELPAADVIKGKEAEVITNYRDNNLNLY